LWVNNVLDIANLALLTGNIGKKGTGIMPLRGQNNVQGAGDMGCLPNQLAGAIVLPMKITEIGMKKNGK
jgi:formate dehydrogenase (NADP+) alpha subunit